MDRLFSTLSRLFSELKRRRVFHMAAVYAVVAWVVVQVANVVFPVLYLPRWTVTLVVLLAFLGFPVAMVLSWAYDITPKGIRRATEESGSPGRAPVSRTVRALLLVGVVLFAGSAGWASWELWLGPAAMARGAAEEGEGEAETAKRGSEELDPRRVAVLYFDDHTEDKRLGYLAAGLTEALIHELSQVEGLQVVSRNGVKPFREADVTLDSVARALDAGSLVEGSVQRYRDSLRVTAQLVDAGTQSHLASRVIRRPWGDLFALQEDLADEVSRLLRRRLGAEVELRERRAATESSGALRRVWRAEELRKDAKALEREGDRKGAHRLLERADSLLARAEAVDPGWVEPVVLRGRLAAERSRPYSPAFDEDDRRWIERGIGHADRALRMEPESADPLALRGTLRYWLYRNSENGDDASRLLEEGERDLRRAVRLDPSHARAWSRLSELLLEAKSEVAEAKLAASRAYEEDAFLDNAAEILKQLCYSSIWLAEYGDAARWCRVGRERYPDNLALVGLELILLASDGGPDPDPGKAGRLVREAARLAPPEDSAIFVSITRMQRAAVLARAGLADSARAAVRTIHEDAPEDPGHWLAYEEANLRLLLGEREQALSLLEEYLERNPGDRSRVARDPWFRELRDEPRFRRLVEAGS